MKTTLNLSIKRFFVLFIISLAFAAFQNCTVNSPVHFTENSKPSLLTIKDEGNGEGYSGKPDIGNYIRTFPDYICDNDSLGIQSSAEVKLNELFVQKDNCQKVDYNLSLLDSRISSSTFNKDYFTLGTSIFEKASSIPDSLPVTEAFCRFQSATEGMEVVLKVDNSLANSSAKIYLGHLNSQVGVWQSQKVPEFKVLRTLKADQTKYSGPGFSIEIQRPSSAYSLSSGYLVTEIEGQTHSHAMDCRTAYSNSLDLSEIWELNSSWINLSGLVGYWKFNELISGSNPTVLDSSPLGISGQLHTDDDPATIKSITSNLVRSLDLNGNDGIFIFSQPSHDPVNSLSVGIWINRSSYGNAPFIGHTNNGGYYLEERTLPNGGGQSVGFTIFVNNLQYHVGISPADLALRQWFHLVGTYDGMAIRFYVDGEEKSSQVISGPITYGTAMPLCIGAQSQPIYSCGAPYALGLLDDGFIFNRALNAEEIRLIYSRQSKTP